MIKWDYDRHEILADVVYGVRCRSKAEAVALRDLFGDGPQRRAA